MSKKFAAIALGMAALGSTAVMAQSPGYGFPYNPGMVNNGPYLGASVGQMFYNEDGLGDIEPTVALFRIGQQFSPYLAIEGRVGTSVNHGNWEGFHVEPQVIYAGYVKGILPLSPWFSAYALGGVGGAQWHRNYGDTSSNDAGLSFGIGGEFYMGGGASLNLEYSRLTNGDNAGFSYNADEVLFGVNWHL